MSLIASTRGIALISIYGRNLAIWAGTSRSFETDPPAIDLVVGYKPGNSSPLLKVFLTRKEEIIEPVIRKDTLHASA